MQKVQHTAGSRYLHFTRSRIQELYYDEGLANEYSLRNMTFEQNTYRIGCEVDASRWALINWRINDSYYGRKPGS